VLTRVPALLIASALLLVSACGGSPQPLRSPISLETPAPGHTRRVVEAHLTMSVTGALTFDLETDTTLAIDEIISDEVPTAGWFLSVASAPLIELDDGRILQFSVDLSPGLYRGPGRYDLSDEGTQTVQGIQSLGSAAYVRFVSSDPPGVEEFRDFGQPCSLDVGNDVRSGHVLCPEQLGTADASESVRLEWSWELL